MQKSSVCGVQVLLLPAVFNLLSLTAPKDKSVSLCYISLHVINLFGGKLLTDLPHVFLQKRVSFNSQSPFNINSIIYVYCQILETIPISDEVSDLVQKLGNFYTEVDGEGEEAEENEVDRRPFTRPFAQHSGNDQQCYTNSTLEGTAEEKRGLCCLSGV